MMAELMAVMREYYLVGNLAAQTVDSSAVKMALQTVEMMAAKLELQTVEMMAERKVELWVV